MADADKTYSIDYRDGTVTAKDTANQNLLNGQVSHKTFQLGMFTTTDNAKWAADRFLKELAYPYAMISFPANRNLFRLIPGDPFVLNYAPYNISGKVYRVLSIQEDGPTSEKIEVRAVLDVEYLSSEMTTTPASDYSEGTGEQFLGALEHTKIIEAPYVLTGTESLIACTIAARLVGKETEYRVFFSLDGTSYTAVGTGVSWAVHGTLVTNYSINTYRIDDNYIDVDFDSGHSDVDRIESVGRSNLLVGTHLALLGDELISFQTITPISGVRYRLSGIFRGRYDTEVTAHNAGTHFYWLNEGNWKTFLNAQYLVNVTRYFKYVPHTWNVAGDISEAGVNTFAITGRARIPYRPFNLRANTVGVRPLYFQSDIVLSWVPRMRGDLGAGKGSAGTITDATISWEGLFKVEVYVSSVLVRTTDAINDDTWTYTGTMNQADNGVWANEVVFKVSNYIIGDDTLTYESVQAEVTVKEE